MKFSRIFLSAAMLVATLPMFAEGYNRVGVSYNNTHFGATWDNADSDDNFNLNGVAIDYIHGFSLSSATPIFIETGAKINFGFRSESEEFGGSKYTEKINLNTLSIPVNFVYRWDAASDFSIQPYVGLNFKLHLSGTEKDTHEDKDGKVENKYNMFKKEDFDPTFNRFQMGWHIGVGFQYKPFYLGISWGTDFIKAYDDSGDGYRTSNLALSVGYSF